MPSLCGSHFQLQLPFLMSFPRETDPLLPHPPFFSFLEMRGAGREKGWKSPWHVGLLRAGCHGAWARGWERPRLLSPQYGPNYALVSSLPVIVVSGSQRVLEICWSSRDLGFPPGMGLDFPLGTACPAPIFDWGVVNP